MTPKIKKGDKVLVLAGKDRGKTGSVEVVLRREGKARVAGVNLVKRHESLRGRSKKAGIIEINLPLPLSRLQLVCPSCNKTTRIGIRFNARGAKERFCKKCQAIIE